jgi:CRISPR-associated protein Cas2
MFIVVSYDIPDDRRRTRLAKLMEGYGERVQYRVFECLLTRTQLRALRRRMLPLLNLREDSVRFYFLPQDAVAEIAVVGVGMVTSDALVLQV